MNEDATRRAADPLANDASWSEILRDMLEVPREVDYRFRARGCSPPSMLRDVRAPYLVVRRPLLA